MSPHEYVTACLRWRVEADDISKAELLEVLDILATHEEHLLQYGREGLLHGPVADLNKKWLKRGYPETIRRSA